MVPKEAVTSICRSATQGEGVAQWQRRRALGPAALCPGVTSTS